MRSRLAFICNSTIIHYQKHLNVWVAICEPVWSSLEHFSLQILCVYISAFQTENGGITLVNVYVDLVVFTRIAGTS